MNFHFRLTELGISGMGMKISLKSVKIWLRYEGLKFEKKVQHVAIYILISTPSRARIHFHCLHPDASVKKYGVKYLKLEEFLPSKIKKNVKIMHFRLCLGLNLKYL